MASECPRLKNRRLQAAHPSSPDAGVDGFHQVLKVGENMGVGFVAMFGYHLAVYNYVKLAVMPRRKLEAGNMLIGPAQCFSCHPGSTQGVASILAVQNL